MIAADPYREDLYLTGCDAIGFAIEFGIDVDVWPADNDLFRRSPESSPADEAQRLLDSGRRVSVDVNALVRQCREALGRLTHPSTRKPCECSSDSALSTSTNTPSSPQRPRLPATSLGPAILRFCRHGIDGDVASRSADVFELDGRNISIYFTIDSTRLYFYMDRAAAEK